MKLKASVRNLNTLKKTELAIFELEGENVKVEWNEKANPSFREMVEADGVATGDGVFFVKDGENFMKALPVAFALSSNIVIEEI